MDGSKGVRVGFGNFCEEMEIPSGQRGGCVDNAADGRAVGTS